MATGCERKSNDEKEEFGPILARFYALMASLSLRHKKVYSKALEDIVSLNPSSILEVGSGPGIAAALIAQKLPLAKILCVDPSSTMVKIANKRFERLSLSARVKSEVGKSSSISTTEKFDLLFSSLSYHHWSDGTKDLYDLAGKYLPAGNLLIYENFIANPDKEDSGVRQHGISMKDIEAMNIPGFKKSYEISGKLVTVKFSAT
ncbi:MAG: class I SAM-dependent methyltransferase [Candidatus Thermoplasmatota archaeon]|nr:class I SAM-dependent methyltransferase [Candidatus Thermoplasmatota archaeon]